MPWAGTRALTAPPRLAWRRRLSPGPRVFRRRAAARTSLSRLGRRARTFERRPWGLGQWGKRAARPRPSVDDVTATLRARGRLGPRPLTSARSSFLGCVQVASPPGLVPVAAFAFLHHGFRNQAVRALHVLLLHRRGLSEENPRQARDGHRRWVDGHRHSPGGPSAGTNARSLFCPS